MNLKIEETPPSEVLFPLWQRALGDTWPISQEAFLNKIGNKNATTFKATDGDKLVGMVTVNGGNITVILVDPDLQRKSLGTELLEVALSKIRESGHSRAVAGQGNGYFWPGVPLNLMGAMQFLKKKGWVEDELVTDMACDLTKYSVPEDIKQKIAISTDVEIRLSTATDADGILEFEKKCFPEWEQTATKAVTNKNFDNVMLAIKDNEIIGTNFLYSPSDENYDNHFPWSGVLSKQTGGYGCLGVNQEFRGLYIGYKLATVSEQLLIERGCKASHLHWVFSIEWYERLGYQVWRQYQEMSINIA